MSLVMDPIVWSRNFPRNLWKFVRSNFWSIPRRDSRKYHNKKFIEFHNENSCKILKRISTFSEELLEDFQKKKHWKISISEETTKVFAKGFPEGNFGAFIESSTGKFPEGTPGASQKELLEIFKRVSCRISRSNSWRIPRMNCWVSPWRKRSKKSWKTSKTGYRENPGEFKIEVPEVNPGEILWRFSEGFPGRNLKPVGALRRIPEWIPDEISGQ